MQTRIYFVRHGKVHNPLDVWYGRLPRFRLGQTGKKELNQTAEFLKTQDIDQLYSSSLLRARQSAKIIQDKLNMPTIHYSSLLLETHSSLQGNPFQLLRANNFAIFANPANGITGETIEELITRVKKFVKMVVRKHKGKNIVAVSHGDPIMFLQAKLSGIPLNNEAIRAQQPYITHGEVRMLEISNRLEFGKMESIFTPKLK